MSSVVRKEDAHKLVDQLPPNATWDDLMHEIYVRETIDKGIEDRASLLSRDSPVYGRSEAPCTHYARHEMTQVKRPGLSGKPRIAKQEEQKTYLKSGRSTACQNESPLD